MLSQETKIISQPKILIVEDDMMEQKIMSTNISRYGYACETASSGAEAIKKARLLDPDVIVLDLFLPDINGIRVCTQLKAGKETRHIPIISVTSSDDRRVRLDSLNAGANDFIGKPVDFSELLIKIRNLVQMKEFEDIKVKHDILSKTVKAIETAKREWEQSMDCIRDAVLLIDSNGLILRCNKVLSTLTGKTYQGLLNRKWQDVLAEGGFTGIPGPVECIEFRHTTGKYFECSVYDITNSDESFAAVSIVTLHDITDRKKAEEDLKNGRTQLQLALDEISALIQEVAVKKNFSVRFENSHLKRCHEFMKCGKEHCISYSDGEDNRRCWQKAGTFCKGDVQGEFAKKYKTCTKCPFFGDATLDPYSYLGEQFNNMMHILETQHTDLENAYNELKLVQSQVLQQEKMASIGQLAAGVAHEINNPMGFIISNLNTLKRYVEKISEYVTVQTAAVGRCSEKCGNTDILPEIAEKRKALKIDYIAGDLDNLIKESLEGADRVKKIVQDLKNFSRVDESEFKTADINAGLESTINIVWNELKYKTTLVREYGDIPLTACNPGQLNQVFMNLLMNASQAIEKTGEIRVKTWLEDDHIKISVADTGGGIPEDIQKRIFEPFYTTKEIGKGTGLGLSIAYDIIKKHKGEIKVDSAVGKGTTFIISLPVVTK
jgi:signal transduction histidine kinase/DNA-binding response OmpR family regulator